MKCPNCQTITREVKTSTHYGIPLVLDQCQNCGGIWFDDSELYRTRLGAAHKLESELDVAKLKKPTMIERELYCPHDGKLLKRIQSNVGFSSVKMGICPKCDGMWLNKGAFSEWQKARIALDDKKNKKKMSKREYDDLDAKIQKQVNALMKMHADLDRKRASTDQFNNISTIGYIIWTILSMIFRR